MPYQSRTPHHHQPKTPPKRVPPLNQNVMGGLGGDSRAHRPMVKGPPKQVAPVNPNVRGPQQTNPHGSIGHKQGSTYGSLGGGGGGGHPHHHHHGGGGGGFGPGWYPYPGYAEPSTVIVEGAADPCSAPWLYPSGACAASLKARGLAGLGHDCKCPGGMGDLFDGSQLTTYALIGGIALLAYRAFLK